MDDQPTLDPGRDKPLLERLDALREPLAEAAQRVVDEWRPDLEGIDELYGSGGACDDVSRAMADVIVTGLDDPDITLLDGGWDGDDHAYLIAVRDDTREAVVVDIPPGVYETGRGYSWKKIDGAQVEPADVALGVVEYSADMTADLEL